MENKTTEEPYIKIELEKNAQYKKKIEDIEREILQVNSTVEKFDITNDYLVKKKEEVVAERKKIIQQNDDLKREIEAKNQLNQIRVQKKVKENNSEEIQKLQAHLQSVTATITELEDKISSEIEKSRLFVSETIKLNIDLRHKNERREFIIASVDHKIKELDSLKDILEDLKGQHHTLREKVNSSLLLDWKRNNR